ncbi:hypothetical protein [Musicola keenii]|uniref:hypothetical protein n=1 Tax=Musicola keenii TaxID=2884250 RepID=UPI001780A756|nr:hypothetical protein [Musicola keenii]
MTIIIIIIRTCKAFFFTQSKEKRGDKTAVPLSQNDFLRINQLAFNPMINREIIPSSPSYSRDSGKRWATLSKGIGVPPRYPEGKAPDSAAQVSLTPAAML